MPLTVHHLQVSQSERVVWLCEELGIPYDLRLYERAPLLAPANYKALHFSAAAPVIQDGDLTLAESAACLEYIANRYGSGKFTMAPSDPEYADYLYWWHWSNGSFQPLVSRLMAASLDPSQGEDNVVIKNAKKRFDVFRKALDERLAKNEWLAGKQISLADMMVVFSLSTMRYFHPYDLKAYPNILAYLDRVGKREGYQKAMKKADPDMKVVLGAEKPVSFIEQAKKAGKL